MKRLVLKQPGVPGRPPRNGNVYGVCRVRSASSPAIADETRQPSRRGVSLLEVVIGVAIFLAAMTAIYRLVSNGAQASVQGRMYNEAVLRAESKLGEVVGGIVPLETVDAMPMEIDENGAEQWFWSMSVTQGDDEYAPLTIEITTYHEMNDGTVNASFTLYRSIRDPQLFEDAALAAEEAAAEEGE